MTSPCCYALLQLFERIVEKQTYSEDDARRLIIQVVEATMYLHDHVRHCAGLRPDTVVCILYDRGLVGPLCCCLECDSSRLEAGEFAVEIAGG